MRPDAKRGPGEGPVQNLHGEADTPQGSTPVCALACGASEQACPWRCLVVAA